MVAGLAACYSPRPVAGSSCDADHPCPAPLICVSTGTCELAEREIDAGRDVDGPPIENCEPTGFDVCGDAIDQDCTGEDATCEANDAPGDPTDVTDGGTFTADLLLSHDDVEEDGCGGDGGRDVFFDVTLGSREVYYFDTFGSDFDVSVRVFPGESCATLGTAQNPACSDDACSSADAQLAVSLPSGTSCIVVDQNIDATRGALVLNVIRGRRDGAPLANTVSGNTCDATSVWKPTPGCYDGDDANAKDLGFFFLICPDTSKRVDARTCSSTTSYDYDTVLYVRKPDAADLDCNDDDEVCPVRTNRTDGHADGSVVGASVDGPGIAWLVVDGFNTGACGNFTVTSTQQ
jgi:hypothetical protein